MHVILKTNMFDFRIFDKKCITSSTSEMIFPWRQQKHFDSDRDNGGLKGIFYPKMKICSQFTHPQAIRDVGVFFSSVEQ